MLHKVGAGEPHPGSCLCGFLTQTGLQAPRREHSTSSQVQRARRGDAGPVEPLGLENPGKGTVPQTQGALEIQTKPSWILLSVQAQGGHVGLGPGAWGWGHFPLPSLGMAEPIMFSTRTHSACSQFTVNKESGSGCGQRASKPSSRSTLSMWALSCVLRRRISPFSLLLSDQRQSPTIHGLWGRDHINSSQETY